MVCAERLEYQTDLITVASKCLLVFSSNFLVYVFSHIHAFTVTAETVAKHFDISISNINSPTINVISTL